MLSFPLRAGDRLTGRALQAIWDVPLNFDAYSMQYTLYPKDSNRQKGLYDVFVVKPGRLANLSFIKQDLEEFNERMMVSGVPMAGRSLETFQHLAMAQNRASTHKLLNDTYSFLLEQWKVRGLFLEGFGQGATREFHTIKDGLWPTIVVTEPGNPEKILWVFTVALDFGQGLPFEWRLVGRNFKGNFPNQLPAKSISLRPGKTVEDLRAGKGLDRRIMFSTSFEDDLFSSAYLSFLPSIVGERAELKHYIKSNDFNEDLGALIHRLALRHELHRWSATPLTPEQRAFHQRMLKAALEGPDMAALLKTPAAELYEGSEPGLLGYLRSLVTSDDYFPTVQNTQLYVEANSYMRRQHRLGQQVTRRNARKVLYRKRYGMDHVKYTCEDEDFGGETDVLELTDMDFDFKTTDALAATAGLEIVRNQVQFPSQELFSPERFPCAFQVGYSQIFDQFFFHSHGVRPTSDWMTDDAPRI